MSSSAAAVGVFTTDAALVVQSWDAWLADATGIEEETARGRPLAELFPDVEQRGLLVRLRRVAESGEVAVLAPAFHEYLLPCAPRQTATHFARMQQHVTIAPLHSGGSVAGVVVTIEDVTARRDRERELARQLKSEDETERLRAVRALAESNGTAPLVDALGDRSWRVRRAAVDGLARERDDAATEALVAAVRERHRDPAVLNAALAALVHAPRDVLPSLLPLLTSADADVRTYAALALGLLEDPRAVGTLVRALRDEDSNVRFHAIEALGRIGSREGAHPLAAVAESRDFDVAFAALDALARIGEPSVAPRLVPLLDDALLQTAVVDALGALGSGEATGPLARLLAEPGAPVAAIAAAIAALDDRHRVASHDADLVAGLARASISPPGTAALLNALRTARADERAPIVRLLGWLDGEGIDEALARAMAEPASRAVAADALVRRGPRALAPLLAVISAEEKADGATGDEEDHETRRAAVAALGRLGSASAVPLLISLLDGAPDVAVVAAGALGHIGDRRAFEALVARLEHPHAALRQVAVAALNSIGHPEMAGRLRAMLADGLPQMREGAARVAGYFGDRALLDPMLAACEDPDESVRRAAVEQLPRFEDARARAAIAAALERGTPGVRAAAARALAHVPAEEALPKLRTACADADPWVRYHAARSLGHFDRAGAREALLALTLHDPLPPVRIAAVEALAQVGDAEALAALRPLADDQDPAVAAPALLALGGARDGGTLDALVDALTHDDRARRIAATRALARRADPASVPALAAAAHRGSDPEERELALAALASIDDELAVEAIVDLAADPRRCGAVVDALARLPEHRAAWLRPALAKEDVAVRCAVIEALGRMRHHAASPLLAEALDDESPAVVAAATHALARLDLRATTG